MNETCWHVAEIGCEKCDPHMSRPRSVTIGPADSTGPLPVSETSSTMAGKADPQAVMLSLVDTLEKDRNAWREKASAVPLLEAQVADLEERLRDALRERQEWSLRAHTFFLIMKDYYHECRCRNPELEKTNYAARQMIDFMSNRAKGGDA